MSMRIKKLNLGVPLAFVQTKARVGPPSGLGHPASLPDRPMPCGRVGRQFALAHPPVLPNAAAVLQLVKILLWRQSNTLRSAIWNQNSTWEKQRLFLAPSQRNLSGISPSVFGTSPLDKGGEKKPPYYLYRLESNAGIAILTSVRRDCRPRWSAVLPGPCRVSRPRAVAARGQSPRPEGEPTRPRACRGRGERPTLFY